MPEISTCWKQVLFLGIIIILLYYCMLEFVPPRVQYNCSGDSFWTYSQRAQEFAGGFKYD